MKNLYFLLLFIGFHLVTVHAQVYSTSENDWSITWQNGTSGRFQAAGGPGLFSDNTIAGNGIVVARLLTDNGQPGGNPQPLRVGQRLRIRITAPIGGGRTGIQPNGARIGFSLRSGTTINDPASPTQAFDRYDVNARFRLEFEGGQSTAWFIDNTGTVSSGMPDFNQFIGGITYEYEHISTEEFNLQVVGGTLYNIKRLYNSGPIRHITLYNVGENRDGEFTDLEVVNMDSISLRANNSETFTVTGVIENNGSTPNHVSKRGVGTVVLTNANTYTGTTVVTAGTLRLNRTGGGTLPATAAVEINNTGTLQVSSNQTLSTLTLREGGTLQVDAGVTLTITGNASFNGTIQNNGRIVLGGTAQQTVTVGGAVNYAAMNELEVNNTSTDGVVVSGGNLRAAQMIFTNGRINLGGNDLIITSNTPGAVSEGNTGSYVFNGRIQRGVAAVGTYHFPLGGAAATNPSSVLYQPARIEITTATSAVDLFASFVGTDPLNPGILPPNTLVNGTSLTGVLNAGYWRINADGGTFDGAYTITVQLRGATNLVGNANRYAVIKRADETQDWQSVGTHNNATQSEAGGVVTAARSALTGFSDFTIAFSTVTLPVTFTRFTAQLQHNGALLEWTAAESSSLSHYEAERSLNGSTFTGFARQQPQAGAAAHSYQLRDAQLPAGTVYYRIAAVSQSGEKRYSSIIALQTTTARNQLRVLPQPAGRSLVLQLNGFERGQYQLTIIGADGRRVLSQTIVHDGGNSTRMVQLNESLPKGIYHILLHNGQLQLRESFRF
ncbi:MAG: autotransporter-associated beta strand repeat-containing protein [Lacibacter sp.]